MAVARPTASRPADPATRQALLDLRNFRTRFDADGLGPAPKGAKQRQWVVIGGSYAGSLAAWFRARFPALAVGAYASSAPIEPIDNYTQFDQQLQRALSPPCKARVRAMNGRLGATLGGGGESAARLKALFDAGKLSDADFAYLAADSVAIAVQYGQKGKLCDRLEEAERGADPAQASGASVARR